MLREIKEQIEDEFDFALFNNLEKTATSIEKNQGKILFIPINKPIPFAKKILNNIVGDKKRIRVLPTPETKKDFQNNIYSGIEFLLKYNGKASVVFFCSSKLSDKYNSIPGSGFIDFKKLKLEDPTRTLTNIIENLMNKEIIVHPPNNLGNFVISLYLSFIIGEYISPKYVHKTPKKGDEDLYIPFAKLESVPKSLKSYYLKAIDISDTNLFENFDNQTKKNIFSVKFKQKYGFLDLHYERKFLEKINDMDNKIVNLFCSLAIEKALKGRLFTETINDISSEKLDKSDIKSLQSSYNNLSENEQKINLQDPRNAAEFFLENFALLAHNLDDQQLDRYLSKARNQFSKDTIKIMDYNAERSHTTLSRVDQFLKLLLQIIVMKNSMIVNQLMDKEKWVDIFVDFLRKKEEIGAPKLLNYKHITSLNEARKKIEYEKEMSEEAERIKKYDNSLSSLSSFMEDWCSFILNSDEKERKDQLTTIFVEKYDKYCSKVVEEYDNIKENKDFLHISDLLKPEDTEKIRIFIIIDGLGYMDYLIMREYDLLDVKPDEIKLVFSNIPSYTPSAMFTILTGICPKESGIYHWLTKNRDEIFHLKKYNYSIKDFNFIDHSSDYDYHLLQKPSLHNSGITLLSKKVCQSRIRLQNLNINPEKNILESVRTEVVEKIKKLLREREEILNDPNKPEEAKKAQKSDFVVYIENFDSYLHSDLSIEEFKNYYFSLSKFLNLMVKKIKSIMNEYSEKNIELTIAADHGKITRREKRIIEKEKKSSFTSDMLTDIVDVKEVYVANFDKADFINKDGIYYVGMISEEQDKVISNVENLIEQDIEIPENKILDIVEKRPFLLSSQKFLFGWTEDIPMNLKEIEGIDSYSPKISNFSTIFDPPDIGILSRYASKSVSQKAHGFHGGTSISEMTTVKMIFKGENDA